MVSGWSLRKNPETLECKSYIDLPKLNLADWTWAWQWSTKNKDILKYKYSKNSKTYYCIPAGDASKVKNSDCKSYFRKLEVGFVDFDSYKSSIGSLHYVDFIKENWLKSQCSCQHWMKNYFCHHVVYIAFKFNLVEFLDIHRAIPIGKSRSRGRPKTIIANSRKASSSESEVSTSDSEKIEKAAKKQVNKKIVKKKTGPKPKQKNN